MNTTTIHRLTDKRDDLFRQNTPEINMFMQAFRIKTNHTNFLTQFISADKAVTQKKEKLFCPKQAEMPSSD